MDMILMTFLCKMMDNALATMKSIFLLKGRYFISSTFSAIGTFFYMVAIVNSIKDSGFGSIIALCVATFLGSYIPAKFIEKMEKDKLYVYDVTTPSFEEGIQFSDSVRELNIPIKTCTIYNNDLQKTLECKVFCSTKAESIMINDLIKENYKYHTYIAKNY